MLKKKKTTKKDELKRHYNLTGKVICDEVNTLKKGEKGMKMSEVTRGAIKAWSTKKTKKKTRKGTGIKTQRGDGGSGYGGKRQGWEDRKDCVKGPGTKTKEKLGSHR